MSWLNNLKIVLKLSLIVALLALVTVGLVGYTVHGMRAIDEGSDDLVKRVAPATAETNRASRFVERYMSLAFQMAAETTKGDVKFTDAIAVSRKSYESAMAKILAQRPEMSASITPVLAAFAKTVAACGPVIENIAKAQSPDDNARAAKRLKEECVPPGEAVILLQEKLQDEMQASANSVDDENGKQVEWTIKMAWVACALGLLVGLVVALLIGIKALARPIGDLKTVMEGLANNNLTAAVPGIERRDEIGEMARTVEVFKKNGLEMERMKAEQAATELRTAQQRKTEMTRLADDFEGAVGEIIQTVSSASTELEASAGTLTATAVRSQELTTVVAAASEQASTNVQSVASATEEMNSSVNEIGRQVHESARMANEAVDQARKTNDRVSELSKAAARIGDVVELINTIAGQTNLLALNATIEAARAGEAGRGFAVVASEVKALAEQTARATGEIGQQITGIQAATQESVNAIKEISGTIEKLSEISSTIAAAVEEQGAATQEISRNVQQAAQGTQRVSSNISDVQRSASETGAASSHVLSAAQSLSGDSNRLKLEVNKFLSTVRAA